MTIANTKVKDIEILQGTTFDWLMLAETVDKTPLDMTGFTGGTAGARGMIRKSKAAAATASFVISILNKTGVIAAKAAGTCDITAAEIAALEPDTSGKCYLLITLTATATAAITAGTYKYDIEMEAPTGRVHKPYMGAFVVRDEQTKP